jgi:hypothetical protein
MKKLNNNQINPRCSAHSPNPKKTILKIAINGIVLFQEGWNMPILPEKIAKFDSNISVKLLVL